MVHGKRLAVLLGLVLCLGLAGTPPAEAGWLDDLSGKLSEVSATLDKVNATLDATFAGPSPEAAKVIEKAQGKTPTADAFVGGLEKSWELSAGKETHEQFKKDPGFVTDPRMLSRLGNVARNLCKQVERKDLDYHFAILKSNDLNAFAAPGGYIYVTEGLMKAAATDDELAGVLAHELGHVQKKHSVKAMEKNVAMGAIVAGLAAWKKTRNYSWVAALGAYFASQKFSRDDEFEADSIAVDLSRKAGYNPRGLVQFFNRINKDSSSTKVTKYFSTHPPTQERIKRVEEKIAKLPGYQAPATPVPQPTSGSTTNGGVVGTPNNSPFPNQKSGSTGTTGTTTRKPTNGEVRHAYEVYLYTKQQYEYFVERKAPYDNIMKAYNAYNTARNQYLALRKAAGL